MGIIPASGFACYAFFAYPRKGILEQVLAAVAFAFVVLMLINNLTDVLLPGSGLLLR